MKIHKFLELSRRKPWRSYLPATDCASILLSIVRIHCLRSILIPFLVWNSWKPTQFLISICLHLLSKPQPCVVLRYCLLHVCTRLKNEQLTRLKTHLPRNFLQQWSRTTTTLIRYFWVLLPVPTVVIANVIVGRSVKELGKQTGDSVQSRKRG